MKSLHFTFTLLLSLTGMCHCQNHCSPNGTTYIAVSTKAWAVYQMQYSLYIGTGSFTVLGNLLVFAAIFPKKEYTKKYFLILTLAFGDLMLGLGYLSSGAHRLIMVIHGVHRSKVTQWECMIRPYTTFFTIGSFLPVVITTVISIERFLAITWPIKFANWPANRIFGTSALACVLLTLGILGGGCWNAWTSTGCYGNFCFPNWGIGYELNGHKQNVVIVCVSLTTFLYTLATINMFKQKQALKHSTQNSATRKKLETQVRITKTFLVIVITTVIGVVAPMILSKYLNRPDTKEIYVYVSPFFWAFHCLNSGLNFVIYMVFNKELRGAILGVLAPCYKVAIEGSTVGPSAASNRIRNSIKVGPTGGSNQRNEEINMDAVRHE